MQVLLKKNNLSYSLIFLLDMMSLILSLHLTRFWDDREIDNHSFNERAKL